MWLKLFTKKLSQRLSKEELSKYPLRTTGGLQDVIIVSEYGIYEAVFESRKPEAKEFKRWIYDIIKTLRKDSGLEGFQVFRMLDKAHQREAMNRLNEGLKVSARIDYIKANVIANKAISTRHGYPKMVKKKEMPPEWLLERQPILDDTVELMTLKDKFGLDISIGQEIYKRHCS